MVVQVQAMIVEMMAMTMSDDDDDMDDGDDDEVIAMMQAMTPLLMMQMIVSRCLTVYLKWMEWKCDSVICVPICVTIRFKCNWIWRKSNKHILCYYEMIL